MVEEFNSADECKELKKPYPKPGDLPSWGSMGGGGGVCEEYANSFGGLL